MSDGEIIENIYSMNRKELQKKSAHYEPMHTTNDCFVTFNIPEEPIKWNEKE
jgi:hypothetical protein